MKPTLALLLLAFTLSIAVSCSSDDDKSSDTTLKIGALLPLTGSLASYGETSKAALEDARDKINAGSGNKVELVVLDTTTDPQMALTKMQQLAAQGIKLVVGPYASSEVTAVRDFANTNGIVLISPLSTATTLAIPNDNIFRYTPDDALEGAAVANLIWEDGVRTVIPINRDDPGNLGLQTSMKAVYEPKGGKVVQGVVYPADRTNFTTTAQELAAILARTQADGSKVAIYLTAFGEVSGLFEAASAIPALADVDWYGSDSVALSKDLIEARQAAAFAVEARYPNPILGLRDADKAQWQPVVDRLSAKLKRTPDAFALAAYDALVVGHTALSSGANTADALGKELVRLSESHVGLTGSVVLNAAGDRAIGNYDFWSVCRTASGFDWKRTATSSSTGQVTHTSC